MNQSPSQSNSVLICSCNRARVYSKEAPERLESLLREAGISVEIVPDLCELAARKDGRLQAVATTRTPIVACHARAVRWLFHRGGAPLDNGTVVLNFREMAPEQIAQALGVATIKEPEQSAAPDANPVATTQKGAVEYGAWFPVIDYDRCVQCMQCLGFCLFGVYGTDDSGQIAALNPDQCKPGCPACARVCPEGAIIFPKFKSGPISGSENSEERPATPKIDISFLMGGDPLQALRQRNAQSRTRFSKDRNTEAALSERRKHLESSGLLADTIPMEVLKSLPSPDEVARKSREAAARSQAALEARKKL